MSHKIYPKFIGKDCIYCLKPIWAKNHSFNKPNRAFCSKSCRASYFNKLRIWTHEAKKKISISSSKNKGKKKPDGFGEKLRQANLGPKSHFWKGGLTNENRKLRNSAKTKNWRKAVFERDNYTCQDCGIRSQKGIRVILNADHVRPWAIYPELRFELSNGKTLCLQCHIKTPTFGSLMSKKLAESDV